MFLQTWKGRTIHLKIIDAHVHFSNITSFNHCAASDSVTDYSQGGYLNEAQANGVVRSVCMGLTETAPGAFPDHCAMTPMKADLVDDLTALPPGMSICLGVNPHDLSRRNIEEMEALIASGERAKKDGSSRGAVSGLKVYAGYYHFHMTDPVYDPVYDLAEKYDLAVAIHTGDTYSDRGLLKYAHPLGVDELAVARPDMRIVACHVGVPWVFDACEVAAKNRNVFIDLSGLLVGSAALIERMAKKPLLTDRYRQALVYLDDYDKILFGSDWPLVPMGAYIDFCKRLIPEEAREKVFYSNALNVYRL